MGVVCYLPKPLTRASAGVLHAARHPGSRPRTIQRAVFWCAPGTVNRNMVPQGSFASAHSRRHGQSIWTRQIASPSLAGCNLSSQHSRYGGCDEHSKNDRHGPGARWTTAGCSVLTSSLFWRVMPRVEQRSAPAVEAGVSQAVGPRLFEGRRHSTSEFDLRQSSSGTVVRSARD